MPVNYVREKGEVVRLRAIRYVDGKQVFLGSVTVKGMGPRQIERAKADLEAKWFGSNSPTASPRQASMPFREWAKAYMATKIIAPSSRANQESYLRNWLYPAFGDRAVSKIVPLDVNALLRRMASKLKESTQNNVMILLAEILDAAIDEGMIKTNVAKMKSIKRPKAQTSQYIEYIWPRETVTAMAELLPERYRPVVWCGAFLGLRPAETLGLGREDLMMLVRRGEDRQVRVRRQLQVISKKASGLPFGKVFKGLKYDHPGRTVPMPGDLADLLAEYMIKFPPVECTLPWYDTAQGVTSHETVELILTSEKGTPVHFQRMMLAWNEALDQLGLPHGKDRAGNGPHALRHYYGSTMIKTNDVAEVSAWMGHKDVQTTLRHYVHRSADTKANLSIMDGLFDARSSSNLTVVRSADGPDN